MKKGHSRQITAVTVRYKLQFKSQSLNPTPTPILAVYLGNGTRWDHSHCGCQEVMSNGSIRVATCAEFLLLTY